MTMAQKTTGTAQRTTFRDSSMRAFESYYANLMPYGVIAGPTAAEAHKDWSRREGWMTYLQTKWM